MRVIFSRLENKAIKSKLFRVLSKGRVNEKGGDKLEKYFR